jgi:hypothetical protein
MDKRGGKRGQVTIFIIIAIIIIALGFLIYSFYPQIKSSLGVKQENPENYIQTCIEDDLAKAVETVSVQGGSISLENYIMYDNEKVEYLCYTNEYYRPCVVQQPMLKQHIEAEIKKEIESEVDKCFSSMKSSYEKKGYSVQLSSGSKKIELLPERVVATFDYSFIITKGDTQNYKSFVVMLNNNLYELSAIADSIIDWEASYGDAEVTAYMTYYPKLKVEKILKGDKGKVYVITNRDTGDKFQFAIRGQIWPAGYLKAT